MTQLLILRIKLLIVTLLHLYVKIHARQYHEPPHYLTSMSDTLQFNLINYLPNYHYYDY